MWWKVLSVSETSCCWSDARKSIIIIFGDFLQKGGAVLWKHKTSIEGLNNVQTWLYHLDVMYDQINTHFSVLLPFSSQTWSSLQRISANGCSWHLRSSSTMTMLHASRTWETGVLRVIYYKIVCNYYNEAFSCMWLSVSHSRASWVNQQKALETEFFSGLKHLSQ